MAIQIIQNGVEAPTEVKDAIAALRKYGYNIEVQPMGKVLVTLHDTDAELTVFFKNFVVRSAYQINYVFEEVRVSWVDLALLDFVAGQVAAAKNDRPLRHALIAKYFKSGTSTELYRNLAGFRKAFEHFDPNASYTVKVV